VRVRLRGEHQQLVLGCDAHDLPSDELLRLEAGERNRRLAGRVAEIDSQEIRRPSRARVLGRLHHAADPEAEALEIVGRGHA
jgi:hypothetical protein